MWNCPICQEVLKDEFASFERHILEKHYDFIGNKIKDPNDIRQQCDKCGEMITNDFNQMLKHSGDKHYAELPEVLKKSFDRWKRKGFPTIIDYDG